MNDLPGVSKRCRIAFAEDVKLPAGESDNYIKWASWRDGTGDFVFAFMIPAERGALAFCHHSQFPLRGMRMTEANALLSWAAARMEHHAILLKLALFDRTYSLQHNIHTGEWEPAGHWTVFGGEKRCVAKGWSWGTAVRYRDPGTIACHGHGPQKAVPPEEGFPRGSSGTMSLFGGVSLHAHHLESTK